MDLFARGGDLKKAAKLAAELGDQAAAVRFSLQAVLGDGAAAYAETTPLQAGEILAAAGHHREAIALFEMGSGFIHAAKSALKLRQEARAARYFEHGKDYTSAALYYERAKKLEPALRALDLETERLRREHQKSGSAETDRKRQENDLERAELLHKLGRSGEAATLLLDLEPTLKAGILFEGAGNYSEAVRIYLKVGDPGKALAILPKAVDLEPRFIAEVYRTNGRAEEAAKILAAHGLTREAAEAFETAGEWVKAAVNWEAAQEPLRAASAYKQGGRPTVAARCLADAGRLSEAAEVYERAGDLAGAATCRMRAGRPMEAATLLLRAGRTVQATEALVQVAPNSPDFGLAAATTAEALVNEGSFQEAMDLLRRVPPHFREVGAIGAACLYWGGRAFEGLGHTAQAAMCYQKLLALPEDHRDAGQRFQALSRHQETTLLQRPAPAKAPLVSVAPGESTHAETPPNAFPPGFVLAKRYEILSELGAGGMGRVYKAHDRELEEVVAIKTLLHPSQDSQEEARLLREVQICRRITHANIVRVYDIGRFPGGLFVTMELLEGKSLDALLKPGRQLKLAQIKGLLLEVLAGLEEAHAQGVVHRDLKPSNILVDGAKLKILDFGIARMSETDVKLTQTGTTLGSPLYMSPEQLQGKPLDGRSDLYSLGILAFTLIAGREPFAGRPLAAIFVAHMEESPPDLRTLRPETPEEWWIFVSRLLAKKPEGRYADAAATRRALATLPG